MKLRLYFKIYHKKIESITKIIINVTFKNTLYINLAKYFITSIKLTFKNV